MKKTNKVVSAVFWQDAAYSFQDKLPKEFPPIEITTGIITAKNKSFINIATNLNYFANKKIKTKDGFLIPMKTIVKIKKIGQFDVQN